MNLRQRIRTIVLYSFISTCCLSAQTHQQMPGLLVSTDYLAEQLGDSSLVLLHYGMKSEYRKEHIPGARYADIWEFLREDDQGIRNEIPDEQELQKALESLGIQRHSNIVIYYEDRNAIPRAARLFYTLEYAGFAGRVAMLQGGLLSWKEEQRPLSSKKPDFEEGDVNLSLNENVRASKEDVISGLDQENTIVVDARPSERFYGYEEDTNSPRQGHIPGAVNLPYDKLTRDDKTHLFKEKDALRDLLEDRGIQEGKKMIVYCGSGIWASSLYFIARYLGYEVQMYDASFQEWGNDDTLPVSSSAASSNEP